MTQLPLFSIFDSKGPLAGNRLSAISDDVIIHEAMARLEARFKPGMLLSTPALLKDYLSLKIAMLEYEVFYVIFLDSQLRLIEMTEMFRGSLSQATVYPREIVKAALHCNAASVVVAHNHPSGASEASRADLHMTAVLRDALQLIDVRLLDHFIVAGASVRSLAEDGAL